MTACLSPGTCDLYTSHAPSERLLVATVSGVVTLERHGAAEAWHVTGQALEGLHVSVLLLEPTRGLSFAGIHGGGLYASLDGGRTWKRKTEGLTYEHVYTLAATRRNGDLILYAGTEPAHLFQSTDYGETWEERPALRLVPGVDRWSFPPPPHKAHVKHIAFDPRDSRTVFVCIEQGGLLKSIDGGETWRELSGFNEDVHRLVLSPANPDLMYITTGGDGLYASADGGNTWEHLSTRSMRIGYPDALLISPRDDALMFMAGASNRPRNWPQTHTADPRVARSRDRGRSWEILERGFPEHMRGNIEAMSMDVWPGGCRIFFGTTEGDVFSSEDEGENWVRIATGLPPVSKDGHYLLLLGGPSLPPDAELATPR